MDTQDKLDNIVELGLKEMFDRLNQRLFNGELTQPPSLRWYYGQRKKAGGFIEFGKFGTVYSIAVRGSLKTNAYAVKRIMIHEMVHLFLVQQFMEAKLDEQGYKISSFVEDNSATFIMKLALVCLDARIEVSQVKKWFVADETKTSISEDTYVQLNDAKSLLGSLA